MKETRLELEEQFSKLEIRPRALAPRASTSADDAAELKWIEEERDGTKKWLLTLAQISEHIDRARSNASADISATQKSRYTQVATLDDLISATRISSTGLQKCSGSLAKVTDELEDHLSEWTTECKAPLPRKPKSLAAMRQHSYGFKKSKTTSKAAFLSVTKSPSEPRKPGQMSSMVSQPLKTHSKWLFQRSGISFLPRILPLG